MTTPAATTGTAPAPSKAAAVAARFSFGGGAPKCATCTKSVYANERCDYDGATFHVECFKCLKCKSRLTARDVAKIAGDIYCKPCFKKVFQEKGRYDSFGDKTVAKWSTTDAARKSSTGAPPAAATTAASTSGTPSVAPISEEAKAPIPAVPSAAPTEAAVASPIATEEPAADTSSVAAEAEASAPVETPSAEVAVAE